MNPNQNAQATAGLIPLGLLGYSLMTAALYQFGLGPFAGPDGNALGFFSMIMQLHKAPWTNLPTQAYLLLTLPALVIVLAAGLMIYLRKKSIEEGAPDNRKHIRGRQYIKNIAAATREFAVEAAREVKAEGEGLRLHPTLPAISLKRECRHFLIVGGVGSGKTQTLWPMMRAAHHRGDSMIVYDSKGDFSQSFPATEINGKRYAPTILAPWDTRSPAWNIAADVTNKSAAREFSASIVPESKSNPMWSNAARSVLTGCIMQLMSEKPYAWGFRDLADLCFRDQPALLATMKKYYPEGQTMVAADNVTTLGIRINLYSFLAPISDLADAWPTPPAAGQGFSLRAWLKNPGPRPLIIQGNGSFGLLAGSFARALFDIFAACVNDPLVLGESKDRRLWVFLDEFAQIGDLSKIAPALEVGRSKGIRVVLGFQDVAQLRHIYGQDRADAWQSLIATQIVCQIQPGKTAEAFADMIGDRQAERSTASHSVAPGAAGGIFGARATITTSTVHETEQVVLPSQLQSDLGPDGNGVKILFMGYANALRLRIPFSDVPKLREPVKIAAWTDNPGHQQRLAAIAEAQATTAAPTPSLPSQPPGNTLSPNAKTEDDGDNEQGEQEINAGTAEKPKATQPWAPDEILKPDTIQSPIQITTKPAPTLAEAGKALAADELKDDARDSLLAGTAVKAAGTELLESLAPGASEVLHVLETVHDVAEAMIGPDPHAVTVTHVETGLHSRKLKLKRKSLDDEQSLSI